MGKLWFNPSYKVYQGPIWQQGQPIFLNTIIQHHLDKFPATRVIEELRQHMYMGDRLSGADDNDEGCCAVVEVETVLK